MSTNPNQTLHLTPPFSPTLFWGKGSPDNANYLGPLPKYLALHDKLLQNCQSYTECFNRLQAQYHLAGPLHLWVVEKGRMLRRSTDHARYWIRERECFQQRRSAAAAVALEVVRKWEEERVFRITTGSNRWGEVWLETGERSLGNGVLGGFCASRRLTFTRMCAGAAGNAGKGGKGGTPHMGDGSGEDDWEIVDGSDARGAGDARNQSRGECAVI
jgi:hypothetical protein